MSHSLRIIVFRCRKIIEKDEDIMKLRTSRKYQKARESVTSDATSRARSTNSESVFGSHQLLTFKTDDVDSGRGSVNSSPARHRHDTDVFVVTDETTSGKKRGFGDDESIAPVPPEVLKQQQDMIRMHRKMAASVDASHFHHQQGDANVGRKPTQLSQLPNASDTTDSRNDIIDDCILKTQRHTVRPRGAVSVVDLSRDDLILR